MEMQMTRPGIGPRSTTVIGNDIAPAQLKAEHILLKRKNLLLLKKEKRIQVRFPFLFLHSACVLRLITEVTHGGNEAQAQTVSSFTARLICPTCTKNFQHKFHPACACATVTSVARASPKYTSI